MYANNLLYANQYNTEHACGFICLILIDIREREEMFMTFMIPFVSLSQCYNEI